jgi:DnaD/phage-associated family protein
MDDLVEILFPKNFFIDLLPNFENVDELKVYIFLVWLHNKKDFVLQKVTENFFISQAKQEGLLSGNIENLKAAIHACVKKELIVEINLPESDETLLVLNTPVYNIMFEKLFAGELNLNNLFLSKSPKNQEDANIFKLYEENIGLITPIMAEILKEDEEKFPISWIYDAVKIAVERNIRNWKYVQAILESWLKEGKDGKIGKDPKNDSQHYKEKWLGTNE